MENDRVEVPSNLGKSATTVDQNPIVSSPPAIDVKKIRSETEDGIVFSKDVRATFSKIRKEKLLKKEKQMEIEKSKMETCDTGAKKRKREEVNTDISKVRFVYHNVRKREIIRSTNKKPTLGEILNPNYSHKPGKHAAKNKRKREKQALQKQSEIKETEFKEDIEIVNGKKIKGSNEIKDTEIKEDKEIVNGKKIKGTNEIKETEIKGDIEIVNGTKIKGTNEIEETEIKKPGKHAAKSRSRRRLRIQELVKKGQRENKEAEMKEHKEIVNETNEIKETGIKEDIEIVNGTKVKGSNEIQDTEIKKPGKNAATNKRKRLKNESQSENKETEIIEDIEIVSGTKIMGTNEINETEIKKRGKNAAHNKRKKLKKQELKKQKEIKKTEIKEDIEFVNETKIIDTNENKETGIKEDTEIVNGTKINDSNEIKETGIKEDINIVNGTKINETINHVEKSKKKLLVFDINGLLVDIVSPRPQNVEADYYIPKRAVFKRPFLDDFLRFCFERFNVAIWSSRTKKVLDPVVNFALGDFKKKLLFIWDASRCTGSGARTREDKHKPIVFKKLRKFWESDARYNLWVKGNFDESNTLLVDDSPYKALLNPKNTGIFPLSYSYENENDDFLGPNGALRTYLEGLAASDDVRTYVDQHPFGQTPIDEKHPQWHFYSRLLKSQKL